MSMPGEAINRLVLIHWEPEAYEHLPLERDTQLLVELVTAALTYREVLIKDTDLILNDRVIRTFLDPHSFDVFAELLRLGLVKILLRPEKDLANTNLDPALYPVTIRSRNIRSFKDRPWILEEYRRRFYAAVDDLLRRYPQGAASVTIFPQDRNPFAQWLGDLLEEWQEVVEIPEFHGIDPEIARLFTRFCREEGAWLNFLRQRNPAAIRPGDEDLRFFRSQAYRCLAMFKGEHEGFKNLVQSVFNGLYCYSEGASGTFLEGYIVEPPHFGASEGAALTAGRFQDLHLIPAASTKTPISPGIGEVLLKTRQSPSGAFECLQLLLARMNTGTAGEAEVRAVLGEVAKEFGRNTEGLRDRGGDALTWIIAWGVVACATGIAGAFGFKPVLMNTAWAASGLMAVAPFMLDGYRSHLRVATISRGIADACRFRGSHLDVPGSIEWR